MTTPIKEDAVDLVAGQITAALIVAKSNGTLIDRFANTEEAAAGLFKSVKSSLEPSTKP